MTQPAAAKAKPGNGIRLFLLALAVASLVTLTQYAACVQEGLCPVGGDFPVFHRAGLLTAQGHAIDSYDTQEAHSWFDAAPGTVINVRPFLNPPTSLLLLYPLGLLSHVHALAIWDGAQLALLLAALFTPYARRTLNPRGKTADVFVLVFPFALYSLMTGQSGMLSAALFLFTLAWRKDQPVKAALALACLSFKPQLGLLLPLLLLKERNWRVLAYVAAFMLLLIGASLMLWGPDIWSRYSEMLGLYRQMVATAPPAYVMPSASAYMAVRMQGFGGTPAFIAQLCVSLGVLALLWRRLSGAQESHIVILLATATFLVSPYSFIYDTVLLIAACLVLLSRCTGDNSTAPDRICLMLLAFIPIVGLKIQFFNIPYTFAVILFAFLLARKREGTV